MCAGLTDVIQIKLAFLDDRKTKMMRDRREREGREARAAAQQAVQASPIGSPTPSSPGRDMPGVGHNLVTLSSAHEDGAVDSD